MMLLGQTKYTEHVNSHAFTSYMAYYNVQQAPNIASSVWLQRRRVYSSCRNAPKELRRASEIQPDGVLPQDDSFGGCR